MTEEDVIIARLQGIPLFCIEREYTTVMCDDDAEYRAKYKVKLNCSDNSVMLVYDMCTYYLVFPYKNMGEGKVCDTESDVEDFINGNEHIYV